ARIRSGPAMRAAYHRICFGTSLAVVGVGCTALATDGNWRVETTAQLAPAAAGVAAGAVLLVAGLLRLPAAASGRAAAAGPALDGARVAGYVLLIGWMLVVQPAVGGLRVRDPRTFLLGVPLVVVVVAVGITVVTASRSPRAVVAPAAAV